MQQPSEAPDIERENIEREPWVAVTLSWVVPGLGQYYGLEKKRGIVLYLIVVIPLLYGLWCVIDCGGNTLLGYILIAVSLILYVVNLIDAFYTIRTHNSDSFEENRRITKDPFLALFLSWLLPGLGFVYIRKWIVGIIVLVAFFGAWKFKENYFVLVALILLRGIITYKTYFSINDRLVYFNRIQFLILLLVSCSVLVDSGIYWCRRHYVNYVFSEGNSMSPTIMDGDIVLRDITKKDSLRRGDIISIKGTWLDNNIIIGKRLIAFEGESVEIRGGGVYVDGNKLDIEPISHVKYYEDSTAVWGREGHPYTVRKGCIFVLGELHSTIKCNSVERLLRAFGKINIFLVDYLIGIRVF